MTPHQRTDLRVIAVMLAVFSAFLMFPYFMVPPPSLHEYPPAIGIIVYAGLILVGYLFGCTSRRPK